MPQYELVVDGRLGQEILSAFPELEATTRAGMTVLSGTLSAPDGVREVLVRLESFGIGLQSMRVVEPRADQARPSPTTTSPGERDEAL